MKKNSFFHRFFAVLLGFICIFSGITVTETEALGTTYNPDAYSYYLRDDYESSPSQLGFNANLVNTSTTFIADNSKLRTADWDVLSGNKSLQVKSCDLRWWSLSVAADEVYVAFEFMALSDVYASNVEYCISTQDSSTGTEGTAGALVYIRSDASGNPTVWSADKQMIKTLDKKVKYEIMIVLKRGLDTYDVYIGDERSSDLKMASPFYSVTGQRIQVSGKSDESVVVFDNLSIFTKCKYPQSFSAQAKIQEPEFVLDYKPQTEARAFYNNVRISLSNPILKENNTAYIPLKDFLNVVGGSYTENSNNYYISVGEFSATLTLDSKEGTANGNNVLFNTAPKKEGKTVYIPLNVFNTLFGLKVWWDETGDMIVISDASFSSNDRLILLNNRFYMNGQPFYELSFNKFDLAYQISSDCFGYNASYPNATYTYEAAEYALKTLAENGFTTIRFFCSAGDETALFEADKKAKYYTMMDSVFDLLDKYNIQANVCLNLPSNQHLAHEYVEGYGYILKTETVTDLIADRNSESRQVMYDYIEEFVGRYKDRHAILMWEIVNEGNLGADIGQGRAPGYSLLQLGEFYADCADKIREIDPNHLITGGDACLRSSQYHLFLGTISGNSTNDWTTDTKLQRLKALALIDYGLDVISTHTYSWGDETNSENGAHCIDDETGESILMDFEYIINEARQLGKGFYAGEFSGTYPTTDMNIQNPDIAEYQKRYLEAVVDAGVQLGHWWTFESNRQGFDDDNTWNCSIQNHSFTFEAIKAANIALKEKYVVNKAAQDNSAEATGLFPVSSSYTFRENTDDVSSYIWLYITAAGVVVVVALGVIFLLMKKNKKNS